MIKQTDFRVHRGTNTPIPADAIIICGRCEMPIWRMTTRLKNLHQHTGYCGIPRKFITMLDGSPPASPPRIGWGEPCWRCPECDTYIITNDGVFFEMPPNFFTIYGNPDASIEHKLRFFIDYEGIR